MKSSRQLKFDITLENNLNSFFDFKLIFSNYSNDENHNLIKVKRITSQEQNLKKE
jgi:hypothetical protein